MAESCRPIEDVLAEYRFLSGALDCRTAVGAARMRERQRALEPVVAAHT
ncbi:hypothetical protein ACWEKT_27020 [Nocardia takedensis]